jgi:hypothetical protein
MAHFHRQVPSPLPFNIFAAKDYLSFTYWKKSFDLVPLNEVDAQYVLRRQKLRAEKNNRHRLAASDGHIKNNNTAESVKNSESNKRIRPNSTDSDPSPENTEIDTETLIASASSTEWLQINLQVQQIGQYIGEARLPSLSLLLSPPLPSPPFLTVLFPSFLPPFPPLFGFFYAV